MSHIKIIKSSQPEFWYNNKIGQIFECIEKQHSGLIPVIVNGERPDRHFVLPEDCIYLDEFRQSQIFKLEI
jgi:hypothetical protein